MSNSLLELSVLQDAPLLRALSLSGVPLLARAMDRPCELYTYHAPAVVITEGHHIRPMYLQKRVYEGAILDHELKFLCGNCHGAVHAWLYWIMGDRSMPNPQPGRYAKQEAERTFAWFEEAVA